MRPTEALLSGPADFAGWRDQARRFLVAGVPPEALEWRVLGEAPTLFAAAATTAADMSDRREAGEEPAPPTLGAHHPDPPAVALSSETRETSERPASSTAGARPDAAGGASPTPPPPERRTAGEQPTTPAPGASPSTATTGAVPPAGRRDLHSSDRRTVGEDPASVASAAAPVPSAARRPSPDSSERRTVGENSALVAPAAVPSAAGPAPSAARRLSPGLSEWRTAGEASASAASDAAAERAPRAAQGSSPDLSEWRTAGQTPAPPVASDAAAAARAPSPDSSEPPAPRGDQGRSATGAGPSAPPTVPRAFVDLSETVVRHRDPERFALLYRVLWRLTHGEPALMRVATDPDIARLEAMAKAVRRDAHKMHAFVRFREIRTEDGPRYVAWFEPEHHILEAEAGFFVRRFASMRWSILTPEASAHWDGAALAMGPGARRSDAPPEDAREDLWRAYYASIFNPARLKPDAMRAEMPVKYWRNLPEARIIPRLIAEAPRRAAEMVERGPSAPAPRRQRDVHLPAAARQPAAVSDVTGTMPADLFTAAADPAEALAALRAEMLALNSLPPWAANSTQMVFGEGPIGAPLLFVGEQPGDEEDIAGRPFVGPAGRMFNKALEEAGIPRNETYVTNAVKHFKFTPTPRRRLHQSPDAGDIAYYRPFLKREIDLVGPELVVTLGATALRALSGKPLAINKNRGEVIPMADGPPVFPTVHPSYLLRLPDPDSKAREYERFVADLKRAHREVA